MRNNCRLFNILWNGLQTDLRRDSQNQRLIVHRPSPSPIPSGPIPDLLHIVTQSSVPMIIRNYIVEVPFSINNISYDPPQIYNVRFDSHLSSLLPFSYLRVSPSWVKCQRTVLKSTLRLWPVKLHLWRAGEKSRTFEIHLTSLPLGKKAKTVIPPNPTAIPISELFLHTRIPDHHGAFFWEILLLFSTLALPCKNR